MRSKYQICFSFPPILLVLSSGFPSNTEDYWKKEYKKLEIEMHHKDDELKKLHSQVENLKLKDDEIRRLQSQIENLTNCITSFQNNVKPFILHPSLPEKLTRIYHPESQRSSWYREQSESSPRSSWFKDSGSSRSSIYRDNVPSPVIPNETAPSSLSIDAKLAQPLDDDNAALNDNSSVTPVNTVPPIFSSPTSVPPVAHSGASFLPDHLQATSKKASSQSKTTRFNRKSPSKDPGLALMQRKYKEVENNEMPGNIVALEQKRP